MTEPIHRPPQFDEPPKRPRLAGLIFILVVAGVVWVRECREPKTTDVVQEVIRE